MPGRSTIIEPVPTPDSQPFWDASAQGRFSLRHCLSCDRPHWYPRPICPLCGSPDTEWRDASGLGEIYSYSVMDKAAEPYAIAYVRLAEGPIMMTNIVDAPFDALRIGMPVKVALTPSPAGFALPCFTPAEC
jgi:uncharacterized OB-fold protein